MVTMILYYEGNRRVLRGSWEEVMAELRKLCPSGYVWEALGLTREEIERRAA